MEQKETFKQMRRPIHQEEKKPEAIDAAKARPHEGIAVSGSMPPALAEAIKRHVEAESEAPPMTGVDAMKKMQEERAPAPAAPVRYQNSPRLAFATNSKEHELLEGIKETVHHYEEVTLPSLGKFYKPGVVPEGGVLHIRLMTGEEESILATTRHVKKGQAINMIFKNCTREPIRPDQMLIADRTYLLIFLRGISYSPEYQVEVKCSECNGPKFSTTIDLDALIVNYCPEDFSPDKLTDTLPTTGLQFTYRFPTGKDENDISDHREARIKQFGDQAADDTWAFRASLLVTEIGGVTTQSAIYAAMSRLPINDVAYIRSCINEPPFGVDTKVNIVCPYCPEAFVVDLPMETNFFFPNPRKKKDTQV